MTWNWQRSDWPSFSWDANRLRKAEAHFLIGSGAFPGTVRHLGAEDQQQLTIEAISSEAITTSEIEGEILDHASVRSSIRGQFGLVTDHRRVKPAEQGIAEMMVGLYRNFSDPLSGEMLFAWHRMLTAGRIRGEKIAALGSYRASPLLTQRLGEFSGTGREPILVIASVAAVKMQALPAALKTLTLLSNSTAFEAALAVRKHPLRASQTPIKTNATKLEKFRRVRRPC